MGDIENSMPTTPARSWQGGGGTYGDPRRHRRGGPDEGAGGEGPAVKVSLHGIDPATITPEIQGLIDGLMQEMDALRWRLDQAEHRQGYLEELADQDDWLPALNRRAFLRELGRFLDHAGAVGQGGALVLFYLDDFEDIRRRAGLSAAREALRHLARQLVGALRATDIVGGVGGAGIGALLTTGHPDGARTKVDHLMATVAERPLTIDGQHLSLRPVAVMHLLEPGETAEGALAAVEDKLRAFG